MRLLAAAVFSALLVSQLPGTPVNKQYVRVATTQKATVQVETPPAPIEQTQPETETPTVTAEPTPPPPPVTPSTHEELMAAAGISPSDYPAVDYIVSHESGWNQDATEPNSGAHGLVQALPFSKTGCDWEDAVCTLVWGQQYAIQRYGGWWGAYNYWVANHNW